MPLVQQYKPIIPYVGAQEFLMAAGEAGQEAAGRAVPWLAREQQRKEQLRELSVGASPAQGVKGKAVKEGPEQPGLPGRASSKRWFWQAALVHSCIQEEGEL